MDDLKDVTHSQLLVADSVWEATITSPRYCRLVNEHEQLRFIGTHLNVLRRLPQSVRDILWTLSVLESSHPDTSKLISIKALKRMVLDLANDLIDAGQVGSGEANKIMDKNLRDMHERIEKGAVYSEQLKALESNNGETRPV